MTTCVVAVGVGAGAGGGSLVDVPPLELPPPVELPLLVLPLELLPPVLLPEVELVPGAEEVPLAPALGVVVPAEPADDTLVFVELSRDFV